MIAAVTGSGRSIVVMATAVAISIAGCGGSEHAQAHGEQAQVLSATVAPWRALLRGDAQGFCDATTTVFANGFLSSLMAGGPHPAGSDCVSRTAALIRQGVAREVADVQLQEHESRWLSRVIVKQRIATVWYRRHEVTLSQRYGDQASPTNVLGFIPRAAALAAKLREGTDGRWRLESIGPIITSIVR